MKCKMNIALNVELLVFIVSGCGPFITLSVLSYYIDW